MTKTVCNLCGKEFDEWDIQEDLGLHYTAGYGSKFDGDTIDCDLCCSCFDKLLNEYLIPKCKYSIFPQSTIWKG